jgi:hypothetical protein
MLRQQLHIAGEHHLDGSVDAAVTLGEDLFGLDRDVANRLPEGKAPGESGKFPLAMSSHERPAWLEGRGEFGTIGLVAFL